MGSQRKREQKRGQCVDRGVKHSPFKWHSHWRSSLRSTTTFSIVTLRVLTLSIKTRVCETEHKQHSAFQNCHHTEWHAFIDCYAECHYAEFHYAKVSYAEFHCAKVNYAEFHYAKVSYAECDYAHAIMLCVIMINVDDRNAVKLSVVMLNVVVLSFIMLSVVMLDVVMLNVVMLRITMRNSLC
jgi:hypothetical protein